MKYDGLAGLPLEWYMERLETWAKRAREKHPEPWSFSWGDGGVVEMHFENMTFSRIISAEGRDSLSEPDVMGPYFEVCHPDIILALIVRAKAAPK